ncbi:MAG: hypothetical protein HY563_01320 [Ignavibacteriales bacterium]|nr:hypothetical protein [Ignavibacteriales bacterium]
MKIFDAEIQKLSAKAEKARVDLKADIEEQVNVLKQQRDSARKKLDDLRSRSGEAWEEVREGADSAWRELRTSIDRAIKKFE